MTRDWTEVFDRLEAIYAYDKGAVDSGVKDERLRAELMAQIDSASEDEFRLEFSRWLRNGLLSEEALAQGYGWEDVQSFCEWIKSGDCRGKL
jgi:hypothetical protein